MTQPEDAALCAYRVVLPASVARLVQSSCMALLHPVEEKTHSWELGHKELDSRGRSSPHRDKRERFTKDNSCP
jgi:hypothetical protein